MLPCLCLLRVPRPRRFSVLTTPAADCLDPNPITRRPFTPPRTKPDVTTPHQSNNQRVIASSPTTIQFIDEPLPYHTLLFDAQRLPIRSILFPTQSPLSITRQQARFDQFLDHMESLSVAASSGGPVFVLHPHPESGLGNNIRSLMTIFFLAIASDRGVRGGFRIIRSFLVNSDPDIFFNLFVPFSNMTQTMPVATRVHEWIQTEREVTRIAQIPISKRFLRSSTHIRTFSDITSSFIDPKRYQKLLESFGLVPETGIVDTRMFMGKMLRSALLQVLLNPEPTLCEQINRHIQILKQRHLIGVQIRAGGQLANFKERAILGANAVNPFANAVIRYMKEKRLRPEDVYLYVSTDSDVVYKEMQRIFGIYNETMVYTVSDYRIGHSSSRKSFSRYDQGKNWESFSNRALMDLLILKESDYLVFSQGSSFGQFAHEVQQTYNAPINADRFLKKQGLQCSVYHHRAKAGKATFVMKSDCKVKVPLQSLGM